MMVCTIICLPINAYADELDDLSNQYNTAVQKKKEIQENIDTLEQEIQETQKNLEQTQEKMDNTLKEMYRTHSTTYLLNLMFGSKSFYDICNSWDYYSKISEQHTQQITCFQNTQKELEEKQNIYNQLLEQANIEVTAAKIAKQKVADQLAIQQASQTKEIFNAEAAVSGSDTFYAGDSVIVERAYSQLGKPYVWGAVGPDSFDCSGLASYCISGQYTRLGTTSTFMGWTQVTDPVPGDICVNNGHCGIYIGNGQMIHAPQSGDVVRIGPVQSGMIFVRP